MRDNEAEDKKTVQDLEHLLAKWSATLPKEFTIGTVGNGTSPSAYRRYPNLHFKADGNIPGLYYADLDPQDIPSNGNGQTESKIEFTDDTEKR